MLDFLKFWKKNEEKKEFPMRIRVRPNDVAKRKNLNYECVLVIEVVKGEDTIIEEARPFTNELLESMKEIYNLPVEFKDLDEPEFEFEEGIDLTEVKHK